MAQWISEASEKTFPQEVLERSKQTPVLVDFWAEWCGPCRTLTPVLEAAVTAKSGTVWLVKVNVDQNPALAAEFGIRGIPAVKAFVDGRFAGEFVGVRDRREVDTFIAQLQPTPEETAIRKAAELLAEGRFDEVISELQPALASPHHRDVGLMMLAQAHVAQRNFAEARQALQQIAVGSLVEEQANALTLRVDLMESAGDSDEAALRQRVTHDPSDPEARWALAGRLLGDGRLRQALEELLELVQRDRAFRDDGARRAMLSIFDTLGADDDLARDFRRQLQIYV